MKSDEKTSVSRSLLTCTCIFIRVSCHLLTLTGIAVIFFVAKWLIRFANKGEMCKKASFA